MLRFALSDFDRPEFSTTISTGFVEIFDSFRDGNLTGEAAKSPFQSGWKAIVSCIAMAYSG